MRILAVDPGARRIGLALCDALQLTTRRLPILQANPRALAVKSLIHLVLEEEVQKILIGLPYNMDGSSGPAAKKAEGFAKDLRHALQKHSPSCEVVLWDERLTSFEAEQRLREGGIAKHKAKDFFDSLAAEVLLQDFLRSNH